MRCPDCFARARVMSIRYRKKTLDYARTYECNSGHWFSTSERVEERELPSPGPKKQALTPGEKKIMAAIRDTPLTNAEICKRLRSSPSSIRVQISRIREKRGNVIIWTPEAGYSLREVAK